MNKQCSLLLHSILFSGALFCLMPTSLAQAAADPAGAQSGRSLAAANQAANPFDATLISYGRGIPSSRGGGGTR